MQLDYKLAAMLKEAAKLGAQEALVQANIIPAFIAKTKAYKLYGRTTVDRWMQTGQVHFHQDAPNSKCLVSVADLAAVAASQSLVQYITWDEKCLNK
ncbi:MULTISPECIES: hypothetical protein [Sphingobacterium]|uniref:hypothetical protein n=1 Tax=Sphingobacterium TaxID=28453 RepID=UPI000EDDC7F2|nr:MULTISPECIES: hypothetical protein [Sphingobacterium]HAL51868.1 hypothetical protein [Sphingobacterium sp.]